MTKRIISILLTLTMVFAFASCGNPKNDDPPKGKDIDFSKIDKIEVTWNTYPISLSDEQMEYVISLLQDGEWSSEAWKISPEYHLKAGEFVFYCDLSNGKIVNTPTTDRTLLLTDEQIDTLKSYFQTVSADAIAQITVGMTYSQVCSILLTDGMNIESTASDEIILQYDCDDGSKFNIVYAYGDGIELPIVIDIIKINTEA